MSNFTLQGPKRGLNVIKKEVEKALADLGGQLHIPADFPIVIRLHESRANYEKRIGMKTPPWHVGNTSADGSIDILHPNSFEKQSSHPKSDFIKILKHELWHAFAKKIVGAAAIPVWLNEGIAMYVAGQVDQYKNQRGYYIEENYVAKLSTEYGWSVYANHDAYKHACLFTSFLIEKYSFEKILGLLRSLNKNYYHPQFEEKFKEIFGISLSEAERNFANQ
ncbi:hypothetical protein HY839_01870 [Candidatus Azambacteria bacterium]|nr:hypothetical protein [Candidatus Azambacteria bacterium]